MKDIDYQIKEAFIKQNENIEIPIEYTKMVNDTLENLNLKIYKNHYKIFNFIITLIATIFSITGVCFATSAISQHIKQNINQGKISTKELPYEEYREKKYILDWDNDYENGFYYKIIENSEHYLNYKNSFTKLPNENEIDFENNFILIISSQYQREIGESNLIIKNITANENTTYITLEQGISDGTNNSNRDIIYAIASKENLKPERKIIIDKFEINIPNMIPIKELPLDYNIEDALNDNCIVVDRGDLLSNNINKLDDLVNLSFSKENNFVRICHKVDKIQIIDIMWINGIFYMNWVPDIQNPERKLEYHTFENLNRCDTFPLSQTKTTVIYDGENKYYNINDNENSSFSFCILIIYI